MVNHSRSPRVGDHVEVDWGVGAAVGVVQEIRQIGPRAHVLVLIDVMGPDGEVLDQQTISARARDVRVLEL